MRVNQSMVMMMMEMEMIITCGHLSTVEKQ